jgi:cytochrome c peroxidase
MVLLLGLAACKPEPEALLMPENRPFELELPAHFPEMDIPVDNPMTADAVELGRLLFHDTRLSRDGMVSCASCHLQHLAFTDGLEISVGIEGRTGFRNSPSLANVGFAPRLFMDGGVPTLEMQILAPIADENEMDHNILLVAEELNTDPQLTALAQSAYQQEINPYTITRSLAAFERSIVSASSKYDLYLQGEAMLTEEEMLGMELFNSDELKCASCHSGALFTDYDYHNIGLYTDYADPGRERISLDENDWGKFKTPSLRNVALTAPYMHDGSWSTLEEVIDFFAEGGQSHPNKDARIQGFAITEAEKNALIAFLNCLSDESLVHNPAFYP